MTNVRIRSRIGWLDWGRDGGPVLLLALADAGLLFPPNFLHPNGEPGPEAALGLSVLLVYGLARELFYGRESAFLAAGVYLTLGAMWPEGGALLGAQSLTLLCGLLSRRNPRWSLGLGLGLALWSQLAPFSALGAALVSLGFLAWDTPRLLLSPYFGGGLALGVILFYRFELEPLAPIFSGFPWFWAAWVFPWVLIAAPEWLRLGQFLTWSWGKFCLSWGAGYGLWALRSPSPTLANWTPLLLIAALLAGRSLGKIWSQPLSAAEKPWRGGLTLWGLLLLALGVCGALSGETVWGCLGAALGGTFLMGAHLLGQGRREAVPLLLWGQWVSAWGLSFVLAQAS
ncbi:MAG: hypothetical protein GC158_15610 [Cyanobacteria bacterium RI_101]|nr:hypothetical protein [Cyanobacteria bacterium RI_101]